MIELIGYIVCYFVASLVVGVWASAWNRNAVVHFVISVLLTPLVGALTLMFSGKRIVYEKDIPPETKVDVIIPDNNVVPMVKVDDEVVTPEPEVVVPLIVPVEPALQSTPVAEVTSKPEKKLTPSQKKQRDYKSRKQQKKTKQTTARATSSNTQSTPVNNLSSTSATQTTPLYTNDYYDHGSSSSSSTRNYGDSCSDSGSSSSSSDSGGSSCD